MTPGSWAITGPPVCSSTVQPPGSESTTATLTEDAQGNGVFSLSWGPGGNADLQGVVLQTNSNQLELNLSWVTSSFTEKLVLTGLGTSFTGTASLSDSLCTFSSTTATLTLDGTGLTACLGSTPSPALAARQSNAEHSGKESILSRVQASNAAAHVASSPLKCPLKVFLKQLEPLRSGLAVHYLPYNLFPVDFVSGRSEPAGNVFRCQSGCADVEVTVLDPQTGLGVSGATVTATVGPVSVAYTGEQYLCTLDLTGVTTKCGQSTSGLTDSAGHLFLRYWAPGEVTSAHATLNVTASAQTCTG